LSSVIEFVDLLDVGDVSYVTVIDLLVVSYTCLRWCYRCTVLPCLHSAIPVQTWTICRHVYHDQNITSCLVKRV